MATKTKNNLPSPDASAEVTTVIAPGTRVAGRLSGGEDVRVHGTVEGTIRLAQTLFVEPEGVLLAEVYARDVVVSGTVVGNIHADNAVVLAASARVVGDIRAPRVSIEPGAALRGAISMDPFDADELEAEASASRGYGQATRTAAAPAARGAISERSEPRRAAAPARQQQAGARLPPRRAQAFTAAPPRESAARAWGPTPRPALERAGFERTGFERTPARRADDEDTIIVQHPAIRSDERPRRRTEALTAEDAATPGEERKKQARPKTLPRGKHKVERVD